MPTTKPIRFSIALAVIDQNGRTRLIIRDKDSRIAWDATEARAVEVSSARIDYVCARIIETATDVLNVPSTPQAVRQFNSWIEEAQTFDLGEAVSQAVQKYAAAVKPS